MSDSQAKKSLHPLVAIAAVSVIVLSIVGVAAMTGLLPGSKGEVKSEFADTNLTTLAPAAPAAVSPEAQSSATKNTASKTSSSSAVNSKQADNQVNKTRDEVVSAEKPARSICNQCGIIESVHSIEQKAEKGSGVGAVAGAVLGGVLGHQVGGGNGKKLATVAGAVGGGYAGNEIEKSRNTHTVYEVKVKMENGEMRTFKPEQKPDWREGDRVKLVDGRLVSNE
ncbi:glycine zipper 2TM domain-containing protein [Undibacterium sp. Ji22W]|uniref:glycine zipper 2TM domain-containing protein n=1 Tax=Undibacterium sp. Ji22W TaxID=3413038 RepID=UPI003BF0317B